MQHLDQTELATVTVHHTNGSITVLPYRAYKNIAEVKTDVRQQLPGRARVFVVVTQDGNYKKSFNLRTNGN